MLNVLLHDFHSHQKLFKKGNSLSNLQNIRQLVPTNKEFSVSIKLIPLQNYRQPSINLDYFQFEYF